MRILQINSARHFGGGERHLVDLTNGLRAGGNEVFLAVAPDSPMLEKLKGIPPDNVLNVKISNSVDLPAALKIAKFIKTKQIDVVHVHTGKDYLPVSIAVRIAGRAKLVLTRHVLFPLKTVQKILLTNVSKAIAVSSGVEASLHKTFPETKIVTIPNGIDIENWTNVDRLQLSEEFRLENNISIDSKVIGTLGELKHLKGQQDLILAAQIVVKQLPETHFVIVGKDNSYDQNFRRELKRLVKTFGMEKQFSWFNWIEDTRALLSSFDVFVSPSHSESFGLAILEAMAAGCAVVATETDGAKEIIEPDKSGVFSEIRNPVKLAETICTVLKDQEKQTELGKNAQIRARINFGIERMIVETEKVYRSVC